MKTNELKTGQKIGDYEVIDPIGFAGTLPTARIITGPNTGVKVILHRNIEVETRPR